MHFKCHKVNFKRSSWYIDFADWIKKEKNNNKPKNNDDKYFQYAATVFLNREAIWRYPEIVFKIKPFIDHHNWEGIKYRSEKNDWGKSQKNKANVALNVLYEKYFQYIFQRIIEPVKNTVSNEKYWNCLTVKILSILPRGITS